MRVLLAGAPVADVGADGGREVFARSGAPVALRGSRQVVEKGEP